MRTILITATSVASLLATAQAASVQVLPGYDSVFPGLCGGVACEQAVGEFRRGDNGATSAEREAGLD